MVTKTSNTACLVQLIYAGTNGVDDPANLTGTGSTSDDVVVAWTYIGASQPAIQATSAGRFTRAGAALGYNNTSYANGAEFFIRAWDLPSTNFPAGAVPSGGYYGDSPMFTVAGNGTIQTIDQFSLTGNFSTALQAIPEPGAVMVAVLGTGLLIGYRRYKYFRR